MATTYAKKDKDTLTATTVKNETHSINRKAGRKIMAKEAIKKSIARSEARAKGQPKDSRQELLIKMGQASYELGCIQEELREANQRHNQAQQKVQLLKAALDKRGEAK